VKISLYGRLAEAIGRQVEVDAGTGCSVGEVRRRLVARYPAAAKTLDGSRAFIANSMVADERILGKEDTVEFLPPVSGG